MNTEVINLLTGEKRTYSLDARSAVNAAYAQSRGDYNTLDYDARYGDLPREGRYGWHIGDWSAPKPRTVVIEPGCHQLITGETVYVNRTIVAY